MTQDYKKIYKMPSDLQNLFKQALAYVKSLPAQPTRGSPQLSNDDKLAFYGLFKQATAGPNNTKTPSKFKVVEKYKWTAWQKLGQMSKQEAMRTYVQRLTNLVPTWNTKAKL